LYERLRYRQLEIIYLAQVAVLVGPPKPANLEFRTDFFNAFNHVEFANPTTLFGSPTFGKITSTSVNRSIIQLALHLNF